MGLAKYREDNLELLENRLRYQERDLLSYISKSRYGKKRSTYKKVHYNNYCPFCNKGFNVYKDLVDHVRDAYGGTHELIYINNRIINSDETISVKRIRSLYVFSFRNDRHEIILENEIGEKYSFVTTPGKYYYDIKNIISKSLFSEIHIINADISVTIKQELDINNASIEKICNGKYRSYLFDNQVSDEKLSLDESFIYMKMLINENENTDFFIDKLLYMYYEKSPVLSEICLYHLLSGGTEEYIKDQEVLNLYHILSRIIEGDFDSVNENVKSIENKNNRMGCELIASLLLKDKGSIDYKIKRYKNEGIIGIIVNVLSYFYLCEKSDDLDIFEGINELRLFLNYPLIKALVELYDSLEHGDIFRYESYILLRKLTPLAAIYYCKSISDNSVKEKILKSMSRIHTDSKLIKEYALDNNCNWMRRKLKVKDCELYLEAIKEYNNKHKITFSDKYINNFPFDDEIKITALGGETEIGASCFVVSYKGYNIMLDCGIDANKKADDAYPNLDKWNDGIDLIIISHAHIDHSGGVPKAHAMWPDAEIITTVQSERFLQYIYSDMARVKNGISDGFEIENVNIEKEVMRDTMNSIMPILYEEKFVLSDEIEVILHPAGHIIGAAMVELRINNKTILYTGDFSDYSQFVTEGVNMNKLPINVDYLICESSYIKRGNVDWEKQYNDLKIEISKNIKSGKSILFPAASIGRSQELVGILGEMKIAGEIPKHISLMIGGMAIPTTTQIIPFMNKRYKNIVGLFKEFNGTDYPDKNSIVIASSGNMTKGSASYEIADYWDYIGLDYTIIANGYFDEETEKEIRYSNVNNIKRKSLSTHVDVNGIVKFIDHVMPKEISFVHRGSSKEKDINEIKFLCKDKFDGDLMIRDLILNKTVEIFDMYKWMIEGERSGK